MDQISMFDLMYPTFKTDNPVRLIELFAGVGSQAMALRNLGVPFEHYLMTYDTKGVFRCYEIKVSKADFHSAAAKSFVGHYNYYVLTRELYNQVKEEIPDWIGVYIGDYCAKKAKKQDLSGREYKMRRSVNGRSTEVSTPWVDMLKESMIRSLYRDSDKLIQTEDEQYISRLRSQIDKTRTERDRESKKYLRLWKAVRKEFGDEKAWELIEKAEE